MSAYETLSAEIERQRCRNDGRVQVMQIDLAEVLAELAALRGASSKPAAKYSDEFESAWLLYPARPGNSKAAAFKAWKTRLKAGATALEMIEGTSKYAAYVLAERTEPQFVKQAATFYGPGEHFSADWTVRRAAAGAASKDLIAEAMRKRRAGPDDFAGVTIDA